MPEEAREQARLVAGLRRAGYLIWATPNGGSRNAREGASLKVQGVLAGAPDLLLLLPLGECVHIEMKSQTGRLSAQQVEVHARLTALGHRVIVARSAEDALSQLQL
jgi:hypothetical protein